MAIFSRRVLQRMLDENAQTDRTAARNHAHKLNRCTDDTISTEWEVAVINGLSAFGAVRHEPESEGAAVLDIHFQSANGRINFIGDVVTVTDFGLEEQNPIEAFEREVVSQARKIKLMSLAGFEFKYGDWSEGAYRDRKVFIAVPDHTRYSEFFDDSFRTWLRQVRDNPTQRHVIRKQADGIDITIAFRPGERHVTRHAASFTVPQSLTRNPLFHALDRKADQFKRAGVSGQTVIFACDGGSESIKRRITRSTAFGAEDIATRFFTDHSVSAVVFVRVERTMLPNSFSLGPPFLKIDLLENQALPQQFGKELRSLAAQLERAIPAPEDDVVNAINHLRWKNNRRVGLSHIGGFEMNSDSVKMSARAVQDLLAGRMPAEDFLKEHAFIQAEGRTWAFNPFELALKKGRLIRDVTIEKSDSEDDDWITFYFSDRDPAIAPFKVNDAT